MPTSRNKELDIPFSVDLISDLNLESLDGFDWDGKATSLFCVVAGNLSDDLDVIEGALKILISYYRGVMYIDGNFEHPDLLEYEARCRQIKQICKENPGCVYLHNHVVILNNVAFIGVNGWNDNRHQFRSVEELEIVDTLRNEDVSYLLTSIKTIQLHPEAKKIILISNSLPSKTLTFDEPSFNPDTKTEPILGLLSDTEKKISAWLFGSYQNTIDVVFANRRYVNNPHFISGVYVPKRIVI